ncbi:MAG: hypothetical protein OCC45_10525 [Desulfotalea sp.]
MEIAIIKTYWQQILFVIACVVVAVRTHDGEKRTDKKVVAVSKRLDDHEMQQKKDLARKVSISICEKDKVNLVKHYDSELNHFSSSIEKLAVALSDHTKNDLDFQNNTLKILANQTEILKDKNNA